MSTIVAIASALGPGGVAVIRLSGQQVVEIAHRLTGCRPKPRHAHFVHFTPVRVDTFGAQKCRHVADVKWRRTLEHF